MLYKPQKCPFLSHNFMEHVREKLRGNYLFNLLKIDNKHIENLVYQKFSNNKALKMKI